MEGLQQRLLENGCFRQEELVFWDCDREQRMRVAAILSKMVAFAGYDYDARGLTHQVLWENREVFFLSRAAIRIHDCPHAQEVLDITTWENGAKAAHMRRAYEMRDQRGRARISARTDWILVDPITRKILRPSAFRAKPVMDSDRALDCPETKKLALPGTDRESLGSRFVRWSDLDVIFSAEITEILSGTPFRKICRCRFPENFTSTTAGRLFWETSCGWRAAEARMAIWWREWGRMAPALQRCASFEGRG